MSVFSPRTSFCAQPFPPPQTELCCVSIIYVTLCILYASMLTRRWIMLTQHCQENILILLEWGGVWAETTWKWRTITPELLISRSHTSYYLNEVHVIGALECGFHCVMIVSFGSTGVNFLWPTVKGMSGMLNGDVMECHQLAIVWMSISDSRSMPDLLLQ